MRKIIRERILDRDGRKCAQCGSTVKLEIDHIIPISKGGREDEDNMQVLCQKCNRTKHNKADYSKYFNITKNKNYIFINKEISKLKINPKEFSKIIDLMFQEHARYFNLD